jgi:hypothetical protein
VKRKSLVEIGIVVALVLFAGWLLRNKLALFSPKLARGISNLTHAKPKPTPPRFTADGEPIALPAPTPATLYPGDLFPLPNNTAIITSVPEPPASKPPVVYVAPFTDAKDAETTLADTFDILYRFQLGANTPNRQLVNLVPYYFMTLPYYRENSPSQFRSMPEASLQRDAALLGSDYFVKGIIEGSVAAPKIKISFIEMQTSRTVVWDSSTAGKTSGAFPSLLAEAVKASAKNLQISDAEVVESGMAQHLPSQQTWELLAATDNVDENIALSAMQFDPDCVFLYSIAWSPADEKKYANMGLKRFPDDCRLLRRKAECFASAKKPYPALVIYSELLRRYPDWFMVSHALPDLVGSAFGFSKDAIEAPPELTASVGLLKQVSLRYPNNWVMLWDYANASTRLSFFIRGGQYAYLVPKSIWKQINDLTGEAVIAASKAAEIRPDCSELLRALEYFNIQIGNSSVDYLNRMISRVHQIDPSNVEAELTAAGANTTGYGDSEAYWEFIQIALKNHQGDAHAMSRIAYSLGSELSTRLSWHHMTPEQVYKESNPLSDQFVKCTEYAMDHGQQVENWMAGMLREMYRQRYGEARANELMESGKQWALTSNAAAAAQKTGDWEKSLKLARLSQENTTIRNAREKNQYYIVKSLWKLKNYDEALIEARHGIAEFPERQTFHYLFAIIADEKGDPLEEAYREAYTAVDIYTTNTGCNETFERLRAKLHKPEHPKLQK